MKNLFPLMLFLLLLLYSCRPSELAGEKIPVQFSGVYPHLAFYNQEAECGTGAVVPWAGRLWVITYGPHLPLGSSDKLYEISRGLRSKVREESLGGTPANRMIHQESNQLFIGPYAIDAEGNVRAIPYESMMGRHTGNARHLQDPENKIYYATMEEGFYEVDVKTLTPTVLYKDGHDKLGEKIEHDPTQVNPFNATLPGAHGKGLYSGQGVLVYANNGEASELALEQFDIEAGALAEWDGEHWTVIRRNQFTEVTGPGGIYGNPEPESDPIWSTGWDHKSLLLGVRDRGAWSFYRLPKASHSYDGAHGWNTEWPRIRDVGTPENPDYLMTMHGMFWRFPGSFTSSNSAGIRPRSAYLKVVGDFARWNKHLVFGCDDSAQREFLNTRSVKGNIEGPGQSNSNLWFTSTSLPDQLGPVTASGAVWLQENVTGGVPSEPFLFAGWPYRSAWIQNHENQRVQLRFQVDRTGDGQWEALHQLDLKASESRFLPLAAEEAGEWVRVIADKNAKLTVHFTYSSRETRGVHPHNVFRGLSKQGAASVTGGLLYGLGDDRRALGISATVDGQTSGYYELDATMNLVLKDDPQTKTFINSKFAIPKNVVTVEESSVLVIDDSGRRWRFPLGHQANTDLIDQAQVRLCREVATERDLLNLHGTFYELPAENADGFAKVRPIGSHDFRIHDYASYRGLLVMTGIDPKQAAGNDHVILSDDGHAAVWLGVIDDLWKLGKPTGQGGPWKQSIVRANIPSDPYLIAFYDQKYLTVTHDSEQEVNFVVELEPVGHGPWMKFMEITVAPGETFEYQFPESFQARWIRFISDRDCRATAWLEYR